MPGKKIKSASSPLLVIAGLPKETAETAARTINNQSNPWHAVASAFGSSDQGIYSSDAPALNLVEQAWTQAVSRASADDPIPNPSRMVLAFVGAERSEVLFEHFGNSAWPVQIVHPDWDWPKGRHWRNEIEVVNLLLAQTLEKVEADAARDARLRLEAARSDEILLLPPRNFALSATERLQARFRSFLLGQVPLATITTGVRIERFPHERLKEFYNRCGGRNKPFAIDARGIVFPSSHSGQHGGGHPPDEAPSNAAGFRKALERRFRFGTPIRSTGFQHDAQNDWNGLLDWDEFDCSGGGSKRISGSHVNIFTNDSVTGGTEMTGKVPKGKGRVLPPALT